MFICIKFNVLNLEAFNALLIVKTEILDTKKLLDMVLYLNGLK